MARLSNDHAKLLLALPVAVFFAALGQWEAVAVLVVVVGYLAYEIGDQDYER